MRFRQGLVVGKFAPLHLGHEWVIERALACCERVLVISYSLPELPGCAAWRRTRWLRRRFPGVRVLVVTPARVASWQARGLAVARMPTNTAADVAHRDFVARLCTEVLGTRVDAVFSSEDYGAGFAAHLQGLWGQSVASVLVDRQREVVPVSGTALRAEVHGLRRFLAPEVYGDFVQRVVLLGGESTGKSTLAAALAAELDTLHTTEYGRERWEAQGGCLSLDDLVAIGHEQVRRERQLAGSCNRVLVCDTSPLTTLLYCEAMFGQAPEALRALAQRRYDLTFVCAADFDFVQDGTRRDAAFRQWQQDWYVARLNAAGVPFVMLAGTLAQRVARVVEVIRGR